MGNPRHNAVAPCAGRDCGSRAGVGARLARSPDDSVRAAFEIPYNASCIDKFQHLGAMEGAPCMRTCMDHLEKEGRIKAGFHNDFRKKKPWRLDCDIK